MAQPLVDPPDLSLLYPNRPPTSIGSWQASESEAREEAGIEVSHTNLEVVGVIPSKGDREYIHFFLKASVWAGEVTNMEPDKCNDLRWFDLNALPDNTIPYVRRAIENYYSGTWFGSFGWQPSKHLGLV